MAIIVIKEKCCTYTGTCHCSGCHCEKSQDHSCTSCIDVCPTDAIKDINGIVIDEDLCDECGLCIDACENDALEMN
jgi:ferredoxin